MQFRNFNKNPRPRFLIQSILIKLTVLSIGVALILWFGWSVPQANQLRSSSPQAHDPAKTVEGNVEDGKKAYETCIPCHGEFGEGAQALDAPRLSNQPAWTLVRQLENFKAGVRGSHQNDIYGAQMRIMAQLLQTDEQVRAVAAYIATIDYRPGGE